MVLPNLTADITPGPTRQVYRTTRRDRGMPLPSTLREKMEAYFGEDLSDVRIHINPRVSGLGIAAVSHGSNIYFSPGHYNPDDQDGLRLLAHELAHVVQEKKGLVAPGRRHGVKLVRDSDLEEQAERQGREAAALCCPPREETPTTTGENAESPTKHEQAAQDPETTGETEQDPNVVAAAETPAEAEQPSFSTEPASTVHPVIK